MAIEKVKSSALQNEYTSFYHHEYLIDSADEIDDVPTNCAPGSFVYTADLSKIWQLNCSGEWVDITED